MKFLTFVDLHEDEDSLKKLLKRAKKEDIDFVICAGDISNFGKGLKQALIEFDKLGKQFYIIPGNHEEKEGLLNAAVSDLKNCVNFHKQAFEIKDYVFLGYGGGGFAQEDKEFRKIARNWYGNYNGKKIVLVTHGPPYLTKIDDLTGKGRHVGNLDYRKFIQRIKPKLIICGHLHETANIVDKIETVNIVNPGWNGMVIELK